MVADVSLKLQEIQRTPGTVVCVRAAPFPESFKNRRKEIGTFKRLRIDMHDFLCFTVQTQIDRRPDILMKTVCLNFLTIQLYGADLQYLKRKIVQFMFLAVRALVPFQIKYDVIHEPIIHTSRGDVKW